ncbi:MAG: TfoX/Sxy family protein [Brevundimonas sp.]|nr:MAG: TfoX/Sxy family protein [Brevundimonas sp.]
MALDRAFEDWARDHLSGLGAFEIKRMFGGAGVMADGVMFAILDDDTIWLKADEAMSADMEAEGSRRFSMGTKAGKAMTLPCWSLPEAAMDDPEEAVAWARRALDFARQKPIRKKR